MVNFMNPVWEPRTRILLALVCSFHLGCGRQIVQPGVSRRPPSVATAPNEFSTLTPENSSGIDARAVLPVPEPEREAFYHEVKPGETLGEIARQFGTTAERLREANGLDNINQIAPGQLIYIQR